MRLNASHVGNRLEECVASLFLNPEFTEKEKRT